MSPNAAARPERALVEAVAAQYRLRGYRTYVDPDGTDYFDLAVRRGGEVGLVEGKAAAAGEVLGQALVRRAWADWVAVAVGSERSARSLVVRTTGRRSESVGVWAVPGGMPTELRPPRKLSTRTGPDDPFEATRARLRSTLESLDRGELPAMVSWSGLLGEVRRASGGRRFREWRLDEIGTDRR